MSPCHLDLQVVWPLRCCRQRSRPAGSSARLWLMKEPVYRFGDATVYGGDCVATMRERASQYRRRNHRPAVRDRYGQSWLGHLRIGQGGFPARDRGRIADTDAFEHWCRDWVSACLRVLKPGGHLITFGSPRKWHRLAGAIEDAGFEIRDQIAWLYATGYPKSRDISGAIDEHHNAYRPDRRTETNGVGATYGRRHRVMDKGTAVTGDAIRWQGWVSGLRPGYEPIVVARKPFDGTFTRSVLTHGTGAMHIAAAPVADSRAESTNRPSSSTFPRRRSRPERRHSGRWRSSSPSMTPRKESPGSTPHLTGRRPRKVVIANAPPI